MADFYVRADGTAAKADAVGPTSDVSKCMPLATFEGATFTAADVVHFSDLGGDYVDDLKPPTSNVTYQAASAENPVFRRSVKIAADSEWTLAGSIYHISVANPIANGLGCWAGHTILAKAADANVAAGQFFPDTATDILYVRLADDSDPGLQDVYLGQDDECCYVTNAKTGIVLDGFTFRHGFDSGTRRCIYLYQTGNVSMPNCTFEDIPGIAIRLYKPTGTTTIEDFVCRNVWNGKTYAGGGGGSLISQDAGGTPTGIVIQRGRIVDCYLGIAGLADDPECAVTIDHNIIGPCHVNCLEFGGTVVNKVTITHNTIIHRPNPDVITNNGHGLVCRDASASIAQIIKSNLFYFDENGVVGAELIQIEETDHEHLDIDYNAYHAIGTPDHTFHYGGAESNNLSDFQTWLAGVPYVGNEAHGMQINPLFFDETDYAPTNIRLCRAGHDGKTIGAVEGQFSWRSRDRHVQEGRSRH